MRKDKLLDTRLASETLATLTTRDKEEKVELREVIDEFHENGFVLILILFALPIALPLPYPPGVTTLFGVPLLIFSIQMLFGYKNIKLPESMGRYQINNSTLIMVASKAVPILQTIEKYLKPRFSFASSVYCEQFVGFVSIICSIAIAIPLPMTNSIPAWGIVIMSSGLLKRDGLVVLIGFVIACIGCTIAFGVVVATFVALKHLIYKFIAR